MKNIKQLLNQSARHGLIIGLAAFTLASFPAKATPYASGCTNYNNGGTPQTSDIGFYMNEAGATVTIIYDDGSTNGNFNGITTGINVPRGSNSFNLQGHNGYKIQCFKIGSGTPSQISVDTDTNSNWANPRGLAVNQNPKNGGNFGRIYCGSSGTGGYSSGSLLQYFKGIGIYALNADFTTALGQGTNAYLTSILPGGPWHMRIAPAGSGLDDKLLAPVGTAIAGTISAVWMISPDLSSYQPLLAGTTTAAGLAAQTHADYTYDGAVVVGSLAHGNLQIWITEGDWGIPGSFSPAAQFPSAYGPNTGSGMYNDLLCFNVGAGPIPATGVVGPPVYAYTVGLEGIAELRPFVEIGKDGKIIGGFGRANNSNPNMQILDPTGQTFLYLGGVAQPYFSQDAGTPVDGDPWNGYLGSGSQVGTYAGIRVSPDGAYIASGDVSDGITVANLVNGIPDETTIFNVPNTPYTANARGMDWDAADNIYMCSSGQFLLRAFSLGTTKVCTTSNDWTGSNGTFAVTLPPVIATLTATQPYASQNYVNSAPPGTPIPGVARIQINTNFLSAPLTVSFTRTGTAIYATNSANTGPSFYKIGSTLNQIVNGMPTNAPYGVMVGTNSVIFPAGAFTGPGNFFADIVITPTAFPVSTNSQTVILGLANPSAYQFGSPSKGTIFIQNTGPQLLVLTAATFGTTMYRGVSNDYARLVITRYGDTNGPGNSAGSVAPNAFTVTNLTYFGTANWTNDFRARAQRADPLDDNKIQPPVDGPTAVVFYPGDTTVTCLVGNPVLHTNFNYTPTNLTIIFNLTNAISGSGSTNGIPTPEGFTYNVLPATLTVTLIDNAVGPEVVVWSDTMTNPASSVNYTLTYAGTNFGGGGMPVVIPNYVNDHGSIYNGGGGTNDFLVNFGSDISTNVVAVPPSPVMLVSNWPQKALKMTVNKSQSTICGVNVYPNQQFGGNYALRFNMFLSLFDQYINNPYITQNYREYALFGVNHYGTNCNWRPSTTMITNPDGSETGMFPTNMDGVWFAVDAGSGGITPDDWEEYNPGPLPNNGNPYGAGGGLRGWISWEDTANPVPGVFKHPPFVASNTTDATRTVNNPGGGQPVNNWVDVSVEITSQTNLTLYVNHSTWMTPGVITNGVGFGSSYTNGTIMLGYDDPDRTTADASAFVYFSNVRVVELSPYLALQPGLLTNNLLNSMIRTQGSSLVLTVAVNYASAPITSVWYKASAATLGTVVGETLSNPYVQSNWFNATFANDPLALNNVGSANASYYVYQVRDPAGSVNSAPVALDVLLTPTSVVTNVGTVAQLPMTVSGPIAVTSYQWQTNNGTTYVNLAASTHYGAPTTTKLWITNCQPSDGKTYSMYVVHPTDQNVTQYVALTVVSLLPANVTNLWGSTATLTVPYSGPTPATFKWKKNGANMTDTGNATGTGTATLTLANITRADAASYTCGVTNGSGMVSSQEILSVTVPPPSFPSATNLVGVPPVTVGGGMVALSFNSPNNPYDTTNSWKLLQAPVVGTNSLTVSWLGTKSPWTTNTSAVWTTNGGSPPVFQVTIPDIQPEDPAGITNGLYFRLLHVQ